MSGSIDPSQVLNTWRADVSTGFRGKVNNAGQCNELPTRGRGVDAAGIRIN